MDELGPHHLGPTAAAEEVEGREVEELQGIIIINAQ
jgi:hypothetical protein